jgi:solute carrier family 25 citrate transporter 1
MDVLKTQMQEQSAKEKSNIIQLSKTIYNKYGLTGFWRGSLARLMRVAPGQGIMFLTFDYVSKLLH